MDVVALFIVGRKSVSRRVLSTTGDFHTMLDEYLEL
jgi:hypothetical protein